MARKTCLTRNTLSLVLLALGLLMACSSQRGDSKSSAEPAASPANSSTDAVSLVSGPSWLKHLGLTQPQTRLGQMGGTESIPASARREPDFGPSGTSRPFVLAGADLYRLNCRSCHGADGKGSPPEINSLIGPVQAASVTAFEERMKARGTEISDEMARELAAEAKKGLRDRLQNGGKTMPAFKHLRSDEVEALLGYLDKLAGVPAGRNANLLVTESAARVGEQVVKGTCHICHDATGPGGGHMAMMRGIVPSLASLPQENSLGAFVRQVQNGSSRMMMMMARPRMPRFPYLTDQEIAAAYVYLADYPPER